MSETVSVKIAIADQAFNVRVPPEDKERCERIAQYVDSTFKELADRGVGAGPGVWAMTAFQIATELFDTQEEAGRNASDRERIRKVVERIESALPRD